MNHALVVDASVAIKRVLDEEFTEQTRALFAASLRAGRRILAPPLLLSEVTNALYQRSRTSVSARKISDTEAERALTAFLRLPVTLLLPAGLHANSLVFSRTYRLSSIYDSLYVVLAQMADVPLWTGDQKLLRSIGLNAPWVRWIGDYPLP